MHAVSGESTKQSRKKNASKLTLDFAVLARDLDAIVAYTGHSRAALQVTCEMRR